MPSINPPLTKSDFDNSCWQDIINSIERKKCSNYGRAFWEKAQAEQNAGNFREQAVFAILAAVTTPAMKPESNEEFFNKIFDHLTSEQLNFLNKIVTGISDPELRSRIADILWVKKHNNQMAMLAIPAYLQSATILESPDHWIDCVDRLERALRLSRKIRYQHEIVLAHIEKVLDLYQGKDPSWLSAKLMALLQEYQFGDPAKYADLAETAATLAESTASPTYNLSRARILWNIKARWHRMEKDKSKEIDALMSVAETYVKESESALKRNPPSYISASQFLQRAVQAFKRIEGKREETLGAKRRAEEVHKILLGYQEEAPNELVSTFSDKMDVSNLAKDAINDVRGKDFEDALFSLALLCSPTNVIELEKQVRQQAHDFILSDLFTDVVINEMGKVVAMQPGSILSDNLEEAKASTYFAMCRSAIYHHTLQAQACIEPARHQIILEHNIRVNDILLILTNSPFIPPDREYLFAKGIYAGLTGDFFTSIHILIPQIENSIRCILRNIGKITSGLDKSGVQNEHNLNSILYYPEVEAIFGENTLFDLKCLLVEHAGSNLRNRMAHGLINDREFTSPIMSYIWWITLRLCCLPMIIHRQQVDRFNENENRNIVT
jgi:Domain of unknown function (DUF4209)